MDHFRSNNSVYQETEHPRWGLIQSVTPTRNIKAGEELFTNYGYKSADFPDDFPWYWETKLAIEREERIEKENKKKEEKAKKDKSKTEKKKKKQKEKKKNNQP